MCAELEGLRNLSSGLGATIPTADTHLVVSSIEYYFVKDEEDYLVVSGSASVQFVPH